MRLSRAAVVLALAGAGLALAPAALGGPATLHSQAAVVKKTVAVSLPGEGDATLASIVLTGKVKPGGGTLALPRVRVANGGSLPASVSVAVSTTRLKGKKNRFLVAVVVVNREPATVGRAPSGISGAQQVQLEVRFLRVNDRFVEGIGVNFREASDVLGTGAGLFAATCTRLLGPGVAPPAGWAHNPLDVDAALVLKIAPKIVCALDAIARVELELIVQQPSVTTAQCSGTLLPYDPTEVFFRVTCPTIPARALAAQANGFDVQLAGSRQITAYLSPPGFSCTISTRATTNDTLSCAGPIAAGAPYQGNIRMSPGPVPGMGGTLYVFAGGAPVGTFAMTGP